MQSTQLLGVTPANPAVAHGDLERTGLLVKQGDPSLATGCHMSQPTTEQPSEGQVVVSGDQSDPAAVLGGTVCRAHLHSMHVEAGDGLSGHQACVSPCQVENRTSSPAAR